MTADAMHTQRDTARQVVQQGAKYVFTVKANQPDLFDSIALLDEESFPPPVTTRDRGHVRIERRTIRTSVALNGYVTFPEAAQVFRVERTRLTLTGKFMSSDTAFGVTSLTPEEADPLRLLNLVRRRDL